MNNTLPTPDQNRNPEQNTALPNVAPAPTGDANVESPSSFNPYATPNEQTPPTNHPEIGQVTVGETSASTHTSFLSIMVWVLVIAGILVATGRILQPSLAPRTEPVVDQPILDFISRSLFDGYSYDAVKIALGN